MAIQNCPPDPLPASSPVDLPPDPLGYRVKRWLLGPPLRTEQLAEERLGKPTALAVFASDNLSSCAYATEEILRVLVPAIGVAAFAMVVHVSVAMLVVLALLILSYRQTIKAYPSAGGAYVVTRDNFGVMPAQVAGVALLTDYVLTVAVSVAAGTAALASAFHGLAPYRVPISVAFIALLAYGNLRGVRESGRIFAVPTYFFIANMGLLLGWGMLRLFFGSLPVESLHRPGLVHAGSAGDGLFMGATLYVVLHAFASGGAAVTGIEAISNGVPAFRPPSWKNARTTLVIMGTCLAVMFFGLSIMAGHMHVAPFHEGTPTVLSEVGRLVYGGGFGRTLFYSLQAGTMLILVLAANTSFAGFPSLASFQAGDSFMPRQLRKRGHRLVFSNGIIFLAFSATALVVITGAKVDRLIPLYAIGVFTSFTFSQVGMARHHLVHKEEGWRAGLAINGVGAVLSAVVAVVIAITKFTHGGWVVIFMVPVIVSFLVRLARQYEEEDDQLEANVPAAATAPILRRHVVLVFVDRLDLASARAIQYARTLTPDELRAVHFVIESGRAEELAEEWRRLGLTRVPLELVNCPDRRMTHSAMLTVAQALADGDTEVSVVVPDRIYTGPWRRLLHDDTAYDLAREVSRLPHANVTTVPFHVGSEEGRVPEGPRPSQSTGGVAATPLRRAKGVPDVVPHDDEIAAVLTGEGPEVPIGSVRWRQRVKVQGEVQAVRVQPFAGVPTLECTLVDGTGGLSVVFLGRRTVAGIEVGSRMKAEGIVGEFQGRLAMLNPDYEVVAQGVEGVRR